MRAGGGRANRVPRLRRECRLISGAPLAPRGNGADGRLRKAIAVVQYAGERGAGVRCYTVKK